MAMMAAIPRFHCCHTIDVAIAICVAVAVIIPIIAMLGAIIVVVAAVNVVAIVMPFSPPLARGHHGHHSC